MNGGQGIRDKKTEKKCVNSASLLTRERSVSSEGGEDGSREVSQL